MKIGILTYHRAYNYGAALLCYALKEVLREMGHDARVIDYRQPDIERFYAFKLSFTRAKARKLSLPKAAALLLLAPLRDLKHGLIHRRMKHIFERFQRERMDLTPACTDRIPQDFDCYVIGSDMLWSYDTASDAFEPVYLGEFPHKPGARIVGYAISGTPRSFRRLGEERKFDFCANFDALSIREKSLADIVSAYTGKPVSCCIDPTLLTTKETWADFSRPKWQHRKYLVTYFLRAAGPWRKALEARLADLAQTEGLEIVDIDVSGRKAPLDVEDFISVIREARYVVTDSFHGVVFSLIFERPFHALALHDSYDDRYVDILRALGADDLAVDLAYTPSIPQIDYPALNERIRQFRSGSLEFLRQNLK